MTTLDLSVSTARAALAGVVDHGADDDDLVVAYARAAWSVLTEPGDRVAGALVATSGPVRALEMAAASTGGEAQAAVAGVEAAELRSARQRWRPRLGEIDRPLEAARRAGVHLITPEDSGWPHRADDLGPFAPLCLWVLGDAAVLSRPGQAVAYVGARAASSYGVHVATELAAESALAAVPVYSGAAYGIDGAAHSATLAAGGDTVALLAGGVDRPYPAGHRELLERIARGGAVVSEVPCGTSPTKWRFLARNRLIAALSDATILVEAGWRSGSLNTAHHAQAIGRPVGVVPGPVTSATSMGCHRLLREGDSMCITGFADVRELLGEQETGLFDAGPYTDERTRILDALSSNAARTSDDVARRGGFAVDDAAAVLGLLELDGVVTRGVGGWKRSTAHTGVT